jgi:hypothetical protein
VKANLKALTCAEVLDWPTFKSQTEKAIEALDEAIAQARAQRAPIPMKTSTR